MRKIEGGTSVRFRTEDGEELDIAYTNMGEPYREGLQLSLGGPDFHYGGHWFLEDHEAVRLRDLLNRLYPLKTP